MTYKISGEETHMFRKMRRTRQQLPDQETIEILKRNADGVLSVLGDDGYPYGVPVNYVWKGGKIYFHSAMSGHKKDAIEKYDKVCFTVVDTNKVLPQERATEYRSVIIFGKARFLEDPEEKLNALRLFAYRHSGDYPEEVEKEIASEFNRTLMAEITVEHMTGKESLGLMQQRDKKES